MVKPESKPVKTAADTVALPSADVVARTLRSLMFLALLLIGMVLTSFALNWQKDQESFWVAHAARVLSTTTDLLSACGELGASSRGYALTHAPGYLEQYQRNSQRVPRLMEQLHQLTRENPVQQRHLRDLRPMLDTFLTGRRKMVETGEGKNDLQPISPLMQFRERLMLLVSEEKRLLALHQSLSAQVSLCAWVGLAAQLVSSLVLLVVVGSSVDSYRRQSTLAIAKLEQARQSAEEARQLAEAASTFKTQLVANVSHEIRTPLSSVLSLVELISEDAALKGDTRHMVDLLTEASKQLMTVLNELLDFGKLDAGRVQFENVVYSVQEIATEVKAINELIAQKKNIFLRLSVSPEVPEELLGDPNKVRQILFNLVSNAMKFTEDGGVEINVDSRDGKLFISVSDTGIGIPEEAQSRLFRPFVQVEGGTRRKYGGTGLGLAIARRYVELMGGEMGVRSKEGAGSMFWFDLPMKVPALEPAVALKQ
jgi:signal transduction histidine kinase